MTCLPRIAVIRDMPEEMWPSMELVADMLVTGLVRDHARRFVTAEIREPMRRRWSRFRLLPSGIAFNADRFVGRFWDYPRVVQQRVNDFDLFHICDHSYAQLVHELPATRTGVFCHDLDAFRCLLDPQREPRPLWFRAMARRVLRGLQAAALVFYSTNSVREQIEEYDLVDPGRLVKAPYGVADEFFSDASVSGQIVRLSSGDSGPYILHVGSCIPRKRVDLLLRVFADIVQQFPGLRLVRVGGDFTRKQEELIDVLGIRAFVFSLPPQPRSALAVLYREASLVLLPSDAEGFGLPVVEALASGAVVVASDIPVLREVGGDAVVFCPPGDVATWVDTVQRLLGGGLEPPAPAIRLRQARHYSWDEHARIIAGAYERLL
jgi:glycosyltransferase involved in cell wall biosynthesis